MSIAVSLGALEDAVRDRGAAAYVLTVSDRGTPHVVHAQVVQNGDGLLAAVGERTALNAGSRPGVSLLYPSRHADDYSLIVDAIATVVAMPEGAGLRLVPTRAVLHRPLPAPDPAASPCGSDCIPLSLPTPR
jgi:hypothetical protein